MLTIENNDGLICIVKDDLLIIDYKYIMDFIIKYEIYDTTMCIYTNNNDIPEDLGGSNLMIIEYLQNDKNNILQCYKEIENTLTSLIFISIK